MKTPLLLLTAVLFSSLSPLWSDAFGENKQQVNIDTIKKFEGIWTCSKISGEDSDGYKEVLDAVMMQIDEHGKCKVIATYKKDVIIHFKGNPNMTKDGRVISQAVIKKVKGGFNIYPVEDDSDTSTIFIRDEKLVTKADDEDVTMIFTKQMAKKNKAEQGGAHQSTTRSESKPK